MLEIGNSLSDVTVLVADDYPFRRDYISQVLESSGAKVVGPFNDQESVLAFLAISEAPQLAYVACGIARRDVHGLVTALAERGLGCVAICPEASGPSFPPGTRMLGTPLAAFQVIEALVQLRHECGGGGAADAGSG